MSHTSYVWSHQWTVVLIGLGHNRENINAIAPLLVSSPLAEPLSLICSCLQTFSMDGFLHLKPFIPQQWDVTEMCCCRISWRDPVLNKTGKRISVCDWVQIALLAWFLFCYRCFVTNMYWPFSCLVSCNPSLHWFCFDISSCCCVFFTDLSIVLK